MSERPTGSVLGAAALLLTLAAACEGPTSILLVVDTDRTDLTRIRISAFLPDMSTAESTADLSERPAPRRLELRHVDGPLGPVVLEIDGNAGRDTRVSARRIVAFESGKQLRLDVTLDDECEPGFCQRGLTCGSDGCRDPEVDACEFAGRSCEADGGAPDAAGVDSGAACNSICRVDELHLPGDRIAPEPCDGDVADYSFFLDEEPLVGARRLRGPGEYVITMQAVADECRASRTVTVVDGTEFSGPDLVPGSLSGFAATVDAGFIASRMGVFVLDDQGARPLVIPSSGNVMWGGIATYDDGLILSGVEGQAVIGFAETAPPYSSATAMVAPLPDLRNRVDALATRGDGSAAAALLTDSGVVLTRLQSGPTFQALSAVGSGSWISWGLEAPQDHGAVWFGSAVTASNLRILGPPALNGGNPVSAPTAVGQIRRAVIDDREGSERLWFCGGQALALVNLAGHDWSSGALPAPVQTLDGACGDVALGSGNDVWAITESGLVRVNPNGSMVWREPGSDAVRLATATGDDGRRAVWTVDPTGKASVYTAEP